MGIGSSKMSKSKVTPQFSEFDCSSRASSMSTFSTEKDKQIVKAAIEEANLGTARRICSHWKMFIVLFISILGMLVFSSFAMSRVSEVQERAIQSINNIEISVLLSDVVLSLQKERGMSTNVLGTDNPTTIILDKLYKFRNGTDNSLNLVNWPQSGVKVDNVTWPLADFKDSIKQFRQNVDNRSIDYLDVLDYYTHLTTSLLKHMSRAVTTKSQSDIQRSIDASTALLSWTDDIGIQRAIGSTFFTRCGWASSFISDYFIKLQGRASAFMDTAISFDETIETEYIALVKNSSLLTYFIENYSSQDLLNEYKTTCSTLSKTERENKSLEWFSNMTVYINSHFSIREKIDTEIKMALTDLHASARFEFVVYVSVLVVIVIMSGVMALWYTYCVANLTGSLSEYVKKAKQKTVELANEKKRSENILYQMLPKKIANDIKCGKWLPAEHFNEVSIYFSDICDFTKISAESKPMEVIFMLNELYSLFDENIEKYDVYKVETIGDCYMLASGVPTPNEKHHAPEIALTALQLQSSIENYIIPHMPERRLEMRSGIHSGSCVAGVVGRKMPRYCLFGDTVNTASRMESMGQRGRIQISSCTQSILEAHGNFRTEVRGNIEIKGKGQMTTYWLNGVIKAENTIVSITSNK